MHHDHHDDPGLRADLERMLELERRRRALRTLAGFTAVAGLPFLGNAVSAAPGRGRPSPSPSPSPAPSPSSACSTIPSETAGPYPGDGTNSSNGSLVNVLTQSGIVRSDIRSSFGSMSGVAAGVPLTVTLKLVNTASVCTTLNGYAVYLWHCDRDGNYSLYTVPAQNYLRGVQVTDSLGSVTFTTIFPGCYSGRWPHMHFEIYPSLSVATTGVNDVKTSQLALPAAVCSEVYAGATGYSKSVTALKGVSLSSDGVFGNDSAALQMATVTGSLSAGYAATLTVGISA
ncbi:intradiol ring-cleavage dioxygenase [Aquabacterium sp.]|uniref:intradiol ring-cleavage dioxygenase n=1 Tax=Aquabacterium sp. TaxID=1872578 RepID=UPI002B9BB3E3|nr:intradiol ring-cleavage dioxygenase [Aquabacterium sp.]HSW07136.1 intradiol ring-cleavage dioxygenase [Aquabacterium sp.]